MHLVGERAKAGQHPDIPDLHYAHFVEKLVNVDRRILDACILLLSSNLQSNRCQGSLEEALK